MTDLNQTRVGDADRERAVSLLNDALTGGYLQIDEFDQRSQQVYAAKTRADLKAVLAELPTAGALFGELSPSSMSQGAVQPLTIEAQWTTVTRKGAWRVAPWTLITGSMGTADLDLRSAELPPGEIVMEVQASWSTIKLRVPEHLTVRYDEVEKSGMSGIKEKGAAAPSVVSSPVLVVRGALSASTLVIRRG